MRLLTNEVVTVQCAGAEVQVAGVDDTDGGHDDLPGGLAGSIAGRACCDCCSRTTPR